MNANIDVQATRQWFHDNALACIAEVESGAVRVPDPASYKAWRLQCAEEALSGRWDHTFAFQQRGMWLAGIPCGGLLP